MWLRHTAFGSLPRLGWKMAWWRCQRVARMRMQMQQYRAVLLPIEPNIVVSSVGRPFAASAGAWNEKLGKYLAIFRIIS